MFVLGLGSNHGDRLSSLRRGIQRLKSHQTPSRLKIHAISPIYESQALLPEGAPESWNQPFLNVNVLCETDLSPLDLLTYVKNIETFIGRQSRGRWAPREIDIDILAWGSRVFQSETLKIPHPGLIDRP